MSELDPASLAGTFLALHQRGNPLIMPNPWDAGSARLLAKLGSKALATTSSGYALTLGREDGDITRDQALAHAREVAVAVDVPVSADLEGGFADEPEEVAQTVTLAAATGLAGCSIEDFGSGAIYDLAKAAARVAAAAEMAHAGPTRLVLTARAENHIRGVEDLADTIARLQSYQEAGADVLFAPGLRSPEQIRSVLAEIDRPLNVIILPGTPNVAELAELGVSRISIGGSFAYAAFGAAADAARELLHQGTVDFDGVIGRGRAAAREVLS